MTIEECLRIAREKYETELRIIELMATTGEVGEDETWRMKKIAYGEYDKEVEDCYQRLEGRSTPGRDKR